MLQGPSHGSKLLEHYCHQNYGVLWFPPALSLVSTVTADAMKAMHTGTGGLEDANEDPDDPVSFAAIEEDEGELEENELVLQDC